MPGPEPIPDLRSPARSVTLHELEQIMLRDVNERHGVTIIMVTHSQEAAEAAKQVARLLAGRIEPAEPRTAAGES